MECERFKKLLKSWYIQVQNESLAPARMVDFMENHVTDCPVCLMDPDAKKDIAKIITLILPQDKLRQTVRSGPGADQDDLIDEAEETSEAVEEEDVIEEEEDAPLKDEEDAEDDEFDDDSDAEEDEV